MSSTCPLAAEVSSGDTSGVLKCPRRTLFVYRHFYSHRVSSSSSFIGTSWALRLSVKNLSGYRTKCHITSHQKIRKPAKIAIQWPPIFTGLKLWEQSWIMPIYTKISCWIDWWCPFAIKMYVGTSIIAIKLLLWDHQYVKWQLHYCNDHPPHIYSTYICKPYCTV